MALKQTSPSNPGLVVETTEQPLCFVIGPIGKEGTSERKHADLLLHTLMKPVLEAEEFGYHVKRADEDADPGMIGDRMITDIIHADLVVADLTDLNANAFYELGIRHSTEKPTILVAKAGTTLPFDLVANRTIFIDLTEWESIEKARTQLAASARAIKAPGGYRVSNPITHANASFKMRESADPRDRLFADLQERLSSIEGRQGEARRDDPNSVQTRLRVVAFSVLEKEAVELLRDRQPGDVVLQRLENVAARAGFTDAFGGQVAGDNSDKWRFVVPEIGSITMTSTDVCVRRRDGSKTLIQI